MYAVLFVERFSLCNLVHSEFSLLDPVHMAFFGSCTFNSLFALTLLNCTSNKKHVK